MGLACGDEWQEGHRLGHLTGLVHQHQGEAQRLLGCQDENEIGNGMNVDEASSNSLIVLHLFINPLDLCGQYPI